MRNALVVVLLVFAGVSLAADRVVVFEDFTNAGCGPCWNIEPQVNSFVNSNLPSGNLCVVRTHVSWPDPNDPIYLANKTEQIVRKAQYGITSVPYLKFDGIIQTTNPGALQSIYDQRLAVPAVISIDVYREGTLSSGTIICRVIAEEDPQWTVSMMLWPILVENNVPGTNYWSGSVFQQAFRDNLLGPYGQEIYFNGVSFPDTIYVEAPYTISPSWDVNELSLATFVQCSYQLSEDEIANANYTNFLDIDPATGIENTDWYNGSPVLTVGPNPSSGLLNISALLPGDAAPTVDVFDVSGRIVASGPYSDMQQVTVSDTGLYIVKLSLPNGQSVTQSVVVVK